MDIPSTWWCIFRTEIPHETMEQVLHGSARTTTAVRAAIQRRPESLQTLAACHGINAKTVAKWYERTTVTDIAIGPTPA